jgi:hypothetical protein
MAGPYQEIEAPDGSIIQFPANMPDAEIEAIMRREYPAKKAPAAPAQLASPFLQKGMGMLPQGTQPVFPDPQMRASLPGATGPDRMTNRTDSAVLAMRRKVEADISDATRKARVKPVERKAGEVGRAETLQQLEGMSPLVAGMGGGNAAQLAGMAQSEQVYDQAGVMSAAKAIDLRTINSIAAGIPGIVNKDFRGDLAQAGEDQPGAALFGDIQGFLAPGMAAWDATATGVNALVRGLIPRGADTASRTVRYGAPLTGQYAGAALQNAGFQAAVQEPIRAEQAGEDLTIGGMADAAARGLKDPLNALPFGLSAANRTWNALTSGIATPSNRAAQMANQFGVGPRQTSASQGIAQTTQQLGGQLQGADIRGLTNIENALRFALRDNPNIPDVNARIADGFQRIRQSLPLEDDPTLNLARLIEREFANDAPQTRDIIRRFLSKVGLDSPGGEAIVGGAANDIRGRQADVLEREAYSVFGDQPKDEAKKVLEGNKRTLGKQGYAAALDNLAPDAPGQDAALQRIATREDAEGILFEAADAEGLTVEQYIQRNPLKSLHEIRGSLASDARDLRAANNPDFKLERTVKSMDAVLEANVPNYKEIRKMYRSEATAFDRLGTTRDQRGGAEGELKYTPGFGERLLGPGGAATRTEGRATAKTVFDSMDDQSKKAAALSVRDVILDDLGKARAAGVDQRYEIAAKFQRLNSEGALQALVDVFGEEGQRIVKRIRQFVDANEFASAIDPLTGSNTMNKAQNMATGAQPFSSGMGQRAQGASNALSESAIADSVLMLSGAPPIISAMRAPGIIGRMLQPGQRTQRNIAETLLRRGEIGSQVPPPPGGPPPITPIDPASVPGTSGGAPPSTAGGSPPRGPNALSGATMSGQRGGKPPPAPRDQETIAREIEDIERQLKKRGYTLNEAETLAEDGRLPEELRGLMIVHDDLVRESGRMQGAGARAKGGAGNDPEYLRAESEMNKASDEVANAEAEIARDLREQGLNWEGEDGDFMGVIDALQREGRLSNYLTSRVADLRAASTRMLDAEAKMKARVQSFAPAESYPTNAPARDAAPGFRSLDPAEKAKFRPQGFGGGDAANALAGAGLGGIAPADSAEERARNMAVGAGIGLGARRFGKAAGSVEDGARRTVGSPRVASAGVPKTPAQAAKFETPGSPEYEAAKAKGLDMSQAGRMARAKEMGFDTETVLYHGTPDSRGIMETGFKTSKEKFGVEDPDRVYFFAENKKVADTYADDRRAFDYQGATAETIPVYLKSRNPKIVDWGGRPFRGKEKDGSGFAIRDYIDQARADGHDSVVIRNVIDTYDGKGKPSTIRAVFDPSNIRSINAAFDPDKAASPILTAGAGGGRRAPEAVNEEYFSLLKQGKRREALRLLHKERGVTLVDSRINRGGAHSPPSASDGAPGYDVAANGIYPDDLYSANGRRYYGTGDDSIDGPAFDVIRSMEANPNKMITVYRSVEKDASGKIMPGDWVTTVRKYAKDHGEANINGDYKIVKKTVYARDIFTDGNSIAEWGYSPQPMLPSHRGSYTADLKRIPNEWKPVYGPDDDLPPIIGNGFGAGGGRKPPKPDSPEAIKAALKDMTAKPKAEPTRLARMVEEGKNADVPPIRGLPDQDVALTEQALRMEERGLSPIEIYDQTGVAMVPYNGAQVPIISPKMGPEELTRQFYTALAEPASKRPDWVKEILARAPRKKGLMLRDKAPAPQQPNALAEPPLPSPGTPYGAIGIGAGIGAATGIPAGVLVGTLMAREQDRKVGQPRKDEKRTVGRARN